MKNSYCRLRVEETRHEIKVIMKAFQGIFLGSYQGISHFLRPSNLRREPLSLATDLSLVIIKHLTAIPKITTSLQPNGEDGQLLPCRIQTIAPVKQLPKMSEFKITIASNHHQGVRCLM